MSETDYRFKKGGQLDRLFPFLEASSSLQRDNAVQIRTAEKTDQPQIVRVIADILREYGDTICLDNCDSDLLDLQRNYFSVGGAFWVLDESGKILGTVAATPSFNSLNEPVGPCQLKRLYLHHSLRGGNWGVQLMQTAVDWARTQGFRQLEFWSDTRFSRAHNFYLKFGCQMTGQVRTVTDTYEPFEEYQFRFDLLPAVKEQGSE